MVDPRVLEKAGIDPTEYSGFAAGFGVERFAMIIHGIKDLREFMKSDKRFLQQFPHFYDDGLTTFLAGEAPYTPPVDLRTDELPDPMNPVVQWEDLLTYNYPAQEVVPSSSEEEEEVDLQQKKTQPEQKQQEKQSQQQPPSTKVQQQTEQPVESSSSKESSSAEIDISSLDIRVGLITKAWEHPEADKLYCEEIDLGEESGPRLIASGLKAYYTVEEMNVGRKVLVVANLKSRKLVGVPSHGMVLCASSADGTSVQFIQPPVDAVVGERITVQGYVGEPATENQVLKKKILDSVFPHLKTNNDCVATYKGVPLMTTAGPCKAASLTNSPIA
jgi:aminoacyl tRNA synthase complex-interacting multifunctional protein 1